MRHEGRVDTSEGETRRDRIGGGSMIFTDEFLASFDASTTDVATACTLPPEIYTSTRRSWRSSARRCSATSGCASGRPARSRTRRLVHLHRQRRADHRRPRQGRGASRAFSAVCRTAACRSPTTPATARRSRARTTSGATASTAACSARRRWSARTASTRSDRACPRSPVELWQGFVFVNFDADAAPLGADAAALRAVPRALRPGPTPSARARSRSPTCRGTGR